MPVAPTGSLQPHRHMKDGQSDITTVSWDRLRETQLAALREQLHRLRTASEFYRKRLEEVDIEGIDSAADMTEIPLLEKDDLRQSLSQDPPLGEHACADFGEVIQTQASSGTTGRPTYVGVSERDLQEWCETVAEVFRTNGMEPGESCIHALGLSKGFVGGIPVLQGLEELGVNVLPIGAEAGPERLLGVVDDLEPENLVATPNFARYLGRQAPSVLGKNASELPIQRVSCGGEPGLDAMREELASLWGADVKQIMGATEIAPAYFAECERNNLHMVRPDRYLPELIDPETEEPLEWVEGTTGEIVMTTLKREVTPMLRYRLGDVVTVEETDCPCERTMPSIHCHGRTDDMLIVRGVNVFPSAIQDVLTDAELPISGVFRIQKSFEGHSTEGRLPLIVECEDGYEAESEDIGMVLTDLLQSRLAVATDVEMVPYETIERPEEDQKVSFILEE